MVLGDEREETVVAEAETRAADCAFLGQAEYTSENTARRYLRLPSGGKVTSGKVTCLTIHSAIWYVEPGQLQLSAASLADPESRLGWSNIYFHGICYVGRADHTRSLNRVKWNLSDLLRGLEELKTAHDT